MARPSIHKDPVKLTLYVERNTRAVLQLAAKSERRSASSLVAEIVLEKYRGQKGSPKCDE
jgi:hypothetical protein